MIFNGSLHEFILADIFQLIVQQKHDGNLILTSGSKQGEVVFLGGKIIYAREGDESIQQKLVNAALFLERITDRQAKELIQLQPQTLVDELLKRNILPENDINALILQSLEDITSDLFSWTEGDYHFESHASLKPYHIESATLEPDFVVMETMRRIDEVKRAEKQVLETHVFVPTKRATKPNVISVQEILESPSGYVMSLLDGISDIHGLSRKSILSRFRVFEILIDLWSDGSITPLPPNISQSIRAAYTRHRAPRSSLIQAYSITALVTLTVVIISMIGGFIKSHFSDNPYDETLAYHSWKTLAHAHSISHAVTGSKASSVNELIRNNLIDYSVYRWSQKRESEKPR